MWICSNMVDILGNNLRHDMNFSFTYVLLHLWETVGECRKVPWVDLSCARVQKDVLTYACTPQHLLSILVYCLWQPASVFCSSFIFVKLFYIKNKTHPNVVVASWVKKITKNCMQPGCFKYWKVKGNMWKFLSNRHKESALGTIRDNAMKIKEMSMTSSPVKSIRTWPKGIKEMGRLLSIWISDQRQNKNEEQPFSASKRKHCLHVKIINEVIYSWRCGSL